MPIIGGRGGGVRGLGFQGAAAPNQVTGLAATDFGTGRAYNNGRIDLSWTAPANNGATISGYKIERSTNGSSYSTLVANTGSSAITYSDTSLSSNQIYYYKVSAINAVGTGLASTAANATATTVPQAPTVSATDVGTGRAYNNGAATVTVSGGATGGKTISSYTATSSPGSFTSTSGSPLTVTGLASATAYTFSVTATNANGSSTATVTNSITATTVPQAPTIGTATSSTGGQATVTFTANATGGKTVSTYTATSSPSSITGSNSVSPITVTGLTNGTAYTFTVTATNANGTSSASAASNSVTPTSLYWVEYTSTTGQVKNITLTGGGQIITTDQSGYIRVDNTGSIVSSGVFSGGASFNSAMGNGYQSVNDRLYFFGSQTGNSPVISTFTMSTGAHVSTVSANQGTTGFSWRQAGVSRDTGYAVLVGRYNDGSGTVTSRIFLTNTAGNGFPNKKQLSFGDSSNSAGAYNCAMDYNGNYAYVGGWNENGSGSLAGMISQFTASGGTHQWTRMVERTSGGGGGRIYAIGTNSSGSRVAGATFTDVNQDNLGVLYWNSSGTLQWQRQINGTVGQGFYAEDVCIDSSSNVYVWALNSSGSTVRRLMKWNSSGVLQWQRSFTGSTSTIVDFTTIQTDDTDIYLSGGSSTTQILRYPVNGSVTGTYSYRGGTLTIATSSLTESAGSLVVSTKTPTVGDVGGLDINGTAPTLPSRSATVTQKVSF